MWMRDWLNTIKPCVAEVLGLFFLFMAGERQVFLLNIPLNSLALVWVPRGTLECGPFCSAGSSDQT